MKNDKDGVVSRNRKNWDAILQSKEFRYYNKIGELCPCYLQSDEKKMEKPAFAAVIFFIQERSFW